MRLVYLKYDIKYLGKNLIVINYPGEGDQGNIPDFVNYTGVVHAYAKGKEWLSLMKVPYVKDVNSAIAKYIHGIAFNAWNFAQKPDTIYLSGGFCESECFVKSLENYCKVEKLGRFVLVQGVEK